MKKLLIGIPLILIAAVLIFVLLRHGTEDNDISTGEQESSGTSAAALEIPDDPSDADEYYWSTATVIDVTDASTSTATYTEPEVITLLEERGFDSYEVAYEYSIEGDYTGESTASEGESDKHPMYFTYYVSAAEELWMIYVIDGAVIAYPSYYNLEVATDVPVMVSESETITSYDGETNQFYVTIPNETTADVRVVEKIDAETLDTLTADALS